MRIPKLRLFCILFLGTYLLAFPYFRAAAQTATVAARITRAVDENNLVSLQGNVHPLARPQFDQGAAPPDLPMERMLLILKRSADQESALKKLLDDQQDKSSPLYHQWVTPEQFGQQFGLADSDIQAVTLWLESHGLRVSLVSKGRVTIEFSGTAEQVQETFHTSVHKYLIGGNEHWANATDPQVPAALVPAVGGVFTLHNFYKRPQLSVAEEQITAVVRPGAPPQFTSTSGQHALAPADYYTIYNFNPLQIFTSANIAIVGRSNINLQDVTYFHYWTFDQAQSAQVIVNGPDPGDLGGREETEAVLDTTWAGSVAPTAGVTLVVSKSTTTTDGVDLSELYIIDNNLADVMSESFGECETNNMLASSPYTVAVGGTMFNENGKSTYWSSSNAQGTLESALSYIPENAWNESCISGQSGCSKPNIWAGGGGASIFFAKPSWQSGVSGIPTDAARDLPDVSLTAAAHDPYLLCLRGSCVPDSQGKISFAAVSGTSASAPAFAAIMALVGQKSLTRLGQPNYVLYRLAAAENLSQCNASNTTSLPPSTCVFNDISVGNNSVPGEAGYGTPSARYQSGKGYDQATGLGSMNVTALINQWNTVAFNPTTTTFSIGPTIATHGDPLNFTGNVKPNSGTGTPSGVVWLVQSGYPRGNFVGDSTVATFPLDAQGSFTAVTHLLPGGTYQVNAHYAGDGTYAGSDAASPVQVTIQPENTNITFSVLTTDANGNFIPFTDGPYGSPVYYKAHVSWQSGYGVPSAYVNFWDNSSSAGRANVDKNGDALTQALTQISAGTHSITAGYYGDNSFSSSVDLTPIDFTISQVATTTTLSSQQTAQALLFTATVTAPGGVSAPTGPITFSNGSTVIGRGYLNGSVSGGAESTATFDGSQLPPGQYSITANYPGDTNYSASKSLPVTLNLVADFTVADRGITSQTVTAGQTANYINDIAITPLFGFSSTVNLSCSVPVAGTSCSINPISYNPSSGLGIGTVMVTTAQRTGEIIRKPTDPLSFRPLIWLSTLIALLFALLVCCTPGRRRGFAQTFKPMVLLASLTLILGMAVIGCGAGGSGGGSSPQPTPSGTPAGTYTVTVIGSSNSVVHAMTLTLVVR